MVEVTKSTKECMGYLLRMKMHMGFLLWHEQSGVTTVRDTLFRG